MGWADGGLVRSDRIGTGHGRLMRKIVKKYLFIIWDDNIDLSLLGLNLPSTEIQSFPGSLDRNC